MSNLSILIIWIRKDDFKSTYQRMHMHASTAIQTAVQLEIDGSRLSLILLSLPYVALHVHLNSVCYEILSLTQQMI